MLAAIAVSKGTAIGKTNPVVVGVARSIRLTLPGDLVKLQMVCAHISQKTIFGPHIFS